MFEKSLVISSSEADSMLRFDFVVKFEKDVCEAGDNVPLLSDFFDVLCAVVQY